MFLSLMISLTFMFITLMLILTCSTISKKSFLDREKTSPFECGFDPKESSRLPFSLRFFIIAIIFLIFDVEILILLPAFISMVQSNLMMWSTTILFFLMIITAGLYYEWKEGALQWK